MACDEDGDAAGEPGVQRLEFQTRQDHSAQPRAAASLYFAMGGLLKNPLCPITGM